MYKIAFTGHRPQKLKNPTKTKQSIREYLTTEKEAHHDLLIISGGALGVDQYAAEVANELGLPYVLILPFPPAVMAAKWRLKASEHLMILVRTAVKTLVCQKEFSFQGYQDRNEAMVDHCNVLCAVFDGSPGGTANCVQYAKEKERDICMIAP